MNERPMEEPLFPSPMSAGLTKREWFAGMALSRSVEVIAQFVMEEPGFKPGTRKLSEIVERASILSFACADAMLKESAK